MQIPRPHIHGHDPKDQQAGQLNHNHRVPIALRPTAFENGSDRTTSSQRACSGNTIFAQVQTRFLSGLSPDHQLKIKTCPSVRVFLDEVCQLDCISKNGVRGSRTMSKLAKLSDNLQPFLRVIDIVVSSHPEYAAIVWGGLNLAMQLASNSASFFEKLSKTLERFSRLFPEYEEVERVAKARSSSLSDRIQESLGRVYEGLLLFIHDVISIFSKSDGRPKAKMMVLGALAFKSFDLRFEDILSQMRNEQMLLELELQIMALSVTESDHAQTSGELQKAMQAAETRAKYADEKLAAHISLTEEAKAAAEQTYTEMTAQKIRSWLYAPRFASDYEDSRKQRESSTCDWIFGNQKYQTWYDSSVSSPDNIGNQFGESALWIHGSPGAGKTVLAATIIDDLLDQWSDPLKRTPVLYYFFRETSQRTDPCDAYRALLAQILHRHKEDAILVDKFSFACSDLSSGQAIATKDELLDLLKLCLDYFDDVFIVLDGIDECQDSESLLQNLYDCGCGRRYKILFVSRLNVSELLRLVPEGQRVTMSNSSVTDDIRLYTRRKLEIMMRHSQFPRTATLEYLTEQLVKGSGHMFLWTRLMINYLRSPALLPKQRLRIASEISSPEGLDTMYARVLTLISRSTEPEIRLAMTILSWLAGARNDLLESELHEAIRIEMDCDADDDFEDFCHTVVMTCRGLVEPSVSSGHTAAGKFLQYTHLSARDYFVQLNSSDVFVPQRLRPYLWTKSETNQKMALTCLKYVIKNLANPLSGDIMKSADLSSLRMRHPLAVYSSSMWIGHLTSASRAGSETTVHALSLEAYNTDLLLALEELLSRPFAVMSWLEASYSCQSWRNEGSSHEQRVRRLDEWCQDILTHVENSPEKSSLHIILRCKDLCADLLMLHQSMGAALTRAPRAIWDEVPAFAPSRFWVASTSTAVDVLNPEANYSNKDFSDKALITISASFLSVSLVAVLSVWPSREFDTYWNSIQDEIVLTEIHQHCEGWVVRYQIWSIAEDTPETLLDTPISLPSTEVWTAIHQSLRKEASGNWRFHFPLVIREDLQAFVVLQTLYTASLPASNMAATIKSASLELEDTLSLKPAWWELRKSPPVVGQRVKRGGPNDLGTYYTYKLTFSRNGRLLYFRDYHQFQQSTLAILSVSESGAVSMLNKCETPASWDEDVVAFHLEAPAIFIFRNRVIYVWEYVTEQLPVVFYKPNCGYQDGLEDMSISNCGQYIVMKFPGRSPVIQNIATFISPGISASSRTLVVQPPRTDISRALLQPGQVIKGTDLEISDDGSYRSLSIQKHRTGIDVNEWTGENKREMMEQQKLIQQRLTMIPEWPSLQTSQVSVRWPSREEQRVKIVVDQPAQKHYSHATAQTAATGPFVIQRDTRALESPAPKSDLKISGLPTKRKMIDSVLPLAIRKRLSARTVDDVKKHAGWS